MKGNIKSFICGMLAMGVLSGIAAFAAGEWQSINVLPNTIKVVVNGKEVQADNFLYNDTTYLPIRAVSEALGNDVQFDPETGTATIANAENIKPTPEPVKNIEELSEGEAVDGIKTEQIDGIYYVWEWDIADKYKGKYSIRKNENGGLYLRVNIDGKIGPTIFDNIPSQGYAIELNWYNTVLQPWLASEGWRQ